MRSHQHRILIFTVCTLLLSGALPSLVLRAQRQPAHTQPDFIDTSGLMDCAHHWRDITDDDKVISPLPAQPVYPATAITGIADNMLLYQKDNGGWPKNYDMQAILTPEQKALLKRAQSAANTTFDNGATHSHITYLAEAWRRTRDARYSTAVVKGIDFILSAQYTNGGWPQFYPDTNGYARYITFNDGAMIGVMNVLHAIVRGDSTYAFVDPARRTKVYDALMRGIACILTCQIKEQGILSVWGQQHDNLTLRPQNARTFEPASICNQESAAIVEFLMSIEHPSKEIVTAVTSAVQWFARARLYGIRVKTIPAPEVKYHYHTATTDRIIISDSSAPPIWPRLTELGTHKPLFSSRDWKIAYSLAEVDRERRTGYAWYTYAPQAVLDAYPQWALKYSVKKIIPPK